MKKGLLLVAFGIISVWLFGMLGETDITGPIFVVMLGSCQVYAAAQNKGKTGENRARKGAAHELHNGSDSVFGRYNKRNRDISALVPPLDAG